MQKALSFLGVDHGISRSFSSTVSKSKENLGQADSEPTECALALPSQGKTVGEADIKNAGPKYSTASAAWHSGLLGRQGAYSSPARAKGLPQREQGLPQRGCVGVRGGQA